MPDFTLLRLEPLRVNITKGSDEFFDIIGTGLTEKKLKFHVSAADNGNKLQGIEVTLDTSTLPTDTKVKVAAFADSTVPEESLDEDLWVVGTLDGNKDSTLTLVILSGKQTNTE